MCICVYEAHKTLKSPLKYLGFVKLLEALGIPEAH